MSVVIDVATSESSGDENLNEIELSSEEIQRRKKFNKRVFPWYTTKMFTKRDDFETWQKYGTGFFLVVTHSGSKGTSQCKIICTNSEQEHESEQLKISCGSAKCNNQTVKCPVQYRVIHCKLIDVWWLQELEPWWRGWDGTNEPQVHLNNNPNVVDRNPSMHTKYKKILNLLNDEDARRTKLLINLIATKPDYIMYISISTNKNR